jgi:lipid-A-disaccharide synthase
MTAGPVIFITAAEASGDRHAAELIRALRVRLPEARFVGAAGPEMARAGCQVVVDLTQRASMLLGPLASLGYYRRAIKKLRNAMAEIQPDIHVPVDSPALNWHLAKAAKQLGVPVMYYIAPQVWAWAPWRIKKVRRLTDHLACLLPFEEDFFNRRGVAATYVGHPLFDRLGPQRKEENCPDLLQAWLDGTWKVALLPGSRPGEIRKHTGPLLRLAGAITRRWPDAKCTITAANQDAEQNILAAISEANNGQHQARPCDIVVGDTAAVLAKSHFAVAVSGTVTLEVAHFGVPMVVVFRVSRLAYNLLGRWLLRIKHFSLVNILAGRAIAVELIPWFGNEKKLLATVVEVMEDIGGLVATRQKLLNLTAPLEADRSGGASANTAEIIATMLGK